MRKSYCFAHSFSNEIRERNPIHQRLDTTDSRLPGVKPGHDRFIRKCIIRQLNYILLVNFVLCKISAKLMLAAVFTFIKGNVIDIHYQLLNIFGSAVF